MFNSVLISIQERYRLRRKSRNKHLVISKDIAKYVDDLAFPSNMSSVQEDYRQISSLLNGSYQSPLSEIKFLQSLIIISKAQNVLEIGTFRGLTTGLLAETLPHNGHIWTCENNPDNAHEATTYWKKQGLTKKITLLEGNAIASMKECATKKLTFDFIYIDAKKSEYPDYYKLSLLLAHRGTIIAIDNTLWAGLVPLKSTHYSHARILNKLNKDISESTGINASTILPAWDGLTLVIV